MATSYKTPGVYVEEISKFPPSVAQVETAIPAFVGYTEKAVVDGVDYHAEEIIEPIKVGSLLDYEFMFGGAPDPTTIEVELNADNSVKKAVVNGKNLLYDSVRMFYMNGGGDCFIVSTGVYRKVSDSVSKEDLLAGLASIEKVDRPTLLVIPESVHLSPEEAGVMHTAMLAQCNKLQDRFAVLDIVSFDEDGKPLNDPVTDFRNNVGMSHLKYGAAYYPWLKTTLPFRIDYSSVIGGSYTKSGAVVTDIKSLFNNEIIQSIDSIDADIETAKLVIAPSMGLIEDRASLSDFVTELIDYLKVLFELSFSDTGKNSAEALHEKFIDENSNFHQLLQTLYDYIYYSSDANSTDDLDPEWDDPIVTNDLSVDFNPLAFSDPTDHKYDIYSDTSTASKAAPYFKALLGEVEKLVANLHEDLKAISKNRTESLLEVDPVYKRIVNAINQQGVVLPPSGAIVGLYAMVDNERGVWKAPANVSIAAVKGPLVNITHEVQENMNVDVNAGKSINAIRAFTGKGTMVWGARTLAGNDNEWRYINVRRFFIMVEESVKKSSSQFVFEANDANTWVKVRAMIENFLFLQWRAGALAGAKPEQAFYVRVGLGQTMTAQDVLNGIMNVEIGMAVVRPAEFIILKFSHKLQES